MSMRGGGLFRRAVSAGAPLVLDRYDRHPTTVTKSGTEAARRSDSRALVQEFHLKEWEENTRDANEKQHAIRKKLDTQRQPQASLFHGMPGYIAPPREAYGSHTLMQYNKFRQDSRTHADFRPEKYTAMILGRPCMQVIMTHDHPPVIEWTPFQAHDLRPLMPVLLTGVTGATSQGLRARFHSPSQWFKAL